MSTIVLKSQKIRGSLNNLYINYWEQKRKIRINKNFAKLKKQS